MTNYESLKDAVELGIIDLSDIQGQIIIKEREEILKQHKHSIWQADDGYYRTHITEPGTGKRKMLKKKKLEDLNDALVKHYKNVVENPLLREVFDEWNDRRLHLEQISESTYIRNKQLYDRYYSECQNVKVKDVEPDELIEFLEEQVPKYKLTSKDFSNLKTLTRGIFNYAKRRKYISWNVEAALLELKSSEFSFRQIDHEDDEEVFSTEEYEIIINMLLDDLDDTNLAILVMFITGIRVGELVALKHEDLNYDNLTIKIHRTERRIQRGDGKSDYIVIDRPKTRAGIRIVPIPEDYAWVMQKLKTTNPFKEYIFYGKKNGKRMIAQTVRNRMYGICDKAGIKRKSPHKARRTYATILLDHHVDHRMVEDLMGHTDIATTERYYHKTRRSNEQKAKVISGFEEFSMKKRNASNE